MKRVARQRRVTPAQRGQIVQRVLVDGWSTRQTALAAGLDERQVAIWVAAYRRDGMASLHRDLGRASIAAWRLWRPLVHLWRRLAEQLRLQSAEPLPRNPSTAPSPLPYPRDDRRHGG